MDMTTISLDKQTRDSLQNLRDTHEFAHYDATISWLLNETEATR